MEMVCRDPQILARNMVVEVEHPIAGKYQMAGNPIKMSGYPATYYEPAPMLGQHNREIMRDVLKMTEEEIESELQNQTAKFHSN